MQDQFDKYVTDHEDRNSINKKRNKGGRPRLSREHRLAVRISVGYTEAEAEAIADRAAAAGVDDIKFIKNISLNLPFKTIPAINREYLVELNRIGNNINQLAHIANASGVVDPNTQQALATFKEEISKLGKAANRSTK